VAGGKTLLEQLLHRVTPFQELGAIEAQFLRQMLGRDALSDAAQEQHDLATGVAGLAPTSAGEQVVDRPALATAVVHDRGTMTIMRLLIRGQGMPLRTSKPVRMQGAQEELIASLLVQ
jgi:hypothetical protein